MENPLKPLLTEEFRNLLRSSVRIFVTFGAAGFIFVVGGILVTLPLFRSSVDENSFALGKDMFMAILPVASTVVTYWFATRRSPGVDPGGNQTSQDGKSGDSTPSQQTGE